MAQQPRYRLLLQAQAGPVPAVVRLRRALKCLLRSFGLKCVAVEEVWTEQADASGESPAVVPPAGDE